MWHRPSCFGKGENLDVHVLTPQRRPLLRCLLAPPLGAGEEKHLSSEHASSDAEGLASSLAPSVFSPPVLSLSLCSVPALVQGPWACQPPRVPSWGAQPRGETGHKLIRIAMQGGLCVAGRERSPPRSFCGKSKAAVLYFCLWDPPVSVLHESVTLIFKHVLPCQT